MMFILHTSCIWATQEVFIIVHGTWGTREAWYKQGGDFFTAIERSIKGRGSVVSFCWSGKVDNQSRKQAGQDLAVFITSYPATTKITLFTHSHGGNVGIIASQELPQYSDKHRIHHFYALATPVNLKGYMPNMQIIDHFYNLFSLDDLVQPVFGIFSRAYPPHQRIANIRIVVNTKGPDHEELHHPLVGGWLTHLHGLAQQAGHQTVMGMPGLLHITNTETAYYAHDPEQEELIKKNEKVVRYITAVFSRKRKSRSAMD
ncbi:MAG TPA: hypothetical protein VLG71_03345 [Candidatus Limnocylindria bacterium]|nr:hypothetical protein [Candidatus Limnocylindria bacterium]